MSDIITYRKPSAKERAVNKGTGSKLTSYNYKGFKVVKCLVGGYRVEFNGVSVQAVATLKAGKVAADKLAYLVA